MDGEIGLFTHTVYTQIKSMQITHITEHQFVAYKTSFILPIEAKDESTRTLSEEGPVSKLKV